MYFYQPRWLYGMEEKTRKEALMLHQPRFFRHADRKRVRRRGDAVNHDYTGEVALMLISLIASLMLLWIGTASAETLYVNTEKDMLCARFGPSKREYVMYRLERGDSVKVDAERHEIDGWIPVIYAGDEVWCYGKFLSMDPPTAFAMAVEAD